LIPPGSQVQVAMLQSNSIEQETMRSIEKLRLPEL